MVGVQITLYGPVPPEGLIVADPFELSQVLLIEFEVAAIALGWVMVTLRVDVQPFTSITVSVYVPAHIKVALLVDAVELFVIEGDHIKV